jgi:hypothetical protein
VGQAEGDGVDFEGNDADLAASAISRGKVFRFVDIREEGDVGIESDSDAVDIEDWEVSG